MEKNSANLVPMAEGSKVIVFGADSEIGAATAQSAQSYGAEVVLAMHDPKKKLPWTKGKDFQRIQANPLVPATVYCAVTKTEAKRAFIWRLAVDVEGMIRVIEALKYGGIEFVVFLSSFIVQGKAEDVTPENPLEYLYAQVEQNLSKMFPSSHAVLRSGDRASNLLFRQCGIQSGTAEVFLPEAEYDFVSVTDVGGVAGSILANGLKGDSIVLIVGPELLSQRKVFSIIAGVLNKPIKIVARDKDATVKYYTSFGYSKRSVILVLESMGRLNGRKAIPFEAHALGSKNVELYTGRPSMRFIEWVQENASCLAESNKNVAPLSRRIWDGAINLLRRNLQL